MYGLPDCIPVQLMRYRDVTTGVVTSCDHRLALVQALTGGKSGPTIPQLYCVLSVPEDAVKKSCMDMQNLLIRCP
jgi:hypothetical protein